MPSTRKVLLLAASVLCGCDAILGIGPVTLDDAGEPSSQLDAGVPDGSLFAEDAGMDGGGDAGSEVDGGSDAGVDAGDLDGGVDAGLDAGPPSRSLVEGGVWSLAGSSKASGREVRSQAFEPVCRTCVGTRCVTGGISP